MKRLAILLLLSSVLSVSATIFNSDGTPANVQSLHDAGACHDGDTITIPAGTFVWTTYVTLSKAIIIPGNGIGSTILQNSSSNPNQRFFSITPAAGKVIQLTGIEFQDGTATTTNYTGYIATDGGTGTDPSTTGSVRFDHCKFSLKGQALHITNSFGVADHCQFFPSAGTVPFYVFNTNWGGGVIGNGSYAAASYLGTNKFFFIEDCDFIYPPGGYYAGVDGWYGTRYVVRHSNFTRLFISVHGTESSQGRGSRVIEVYNNTFFNDFAGASVICDIRSGTAAIHDNTATGYASPTITVTDDREIAPFDPFGAADGTNGWDINDTADHTGNGYGGGTGGKFAAGTATSVGSFTVTDSGASWPVNNWVDYTIRKTGGSSSASTASTIRSNTATQITFTNGGGHGDLVFTNGDTFEIRKVIQSLDQPGRVMGTLLVGATPSIPGGWNDQVTEPIYSWNNKRTEDNSDILIGGAAAGSLRAGEHYINNGATPMPGYTTYTYPHPLTILPGGFTPFVVKSKQTPTPSPSKKKSGTLVAER